MTACTDLADYEWLTGSEAGAILDELSADSTPLHTAVARLRGRLTPTQTHLLMEQAELRRRASAKFPQAHRMFFTRVGLEQATDEWVARYKASRFTPQRAEASPGLSLSNTPPPRVADLCCGIGGDLIALSQAATAVGIDGNPIAAHFAAINSGAPIHATDISNFNFDDITAWHIDPDRRPGGRRTTSLEWCEPSRDTIDRLLIQVPHAAVKLAPACEVPDEWSEHCELEWISRDRECRQLVAWHGNLATSPGEHRATIVSTASGLASRTIAGQAKQPVPIAGKPDRYIFDIDPAVLAAKLKGVLAAENKLSALSAGPTYLTGTQPIIDPALACFEVDAVMPLRVRELAKHLRACSIGQLEIKKRGIEIDPEKLRKQLRLRGNNAATLLITQVAGRPTVIVARRVNT
jgi:hypothetical protein